MPIRNKDGSVYKSGTTNNVSLEPMVCKDLPIFHTEEKLPESVEKQIEEIKEFIPAVIDPPIIKNKLLSWVMPAQIVEEDSLYGPKRSFKYGEKFTTELILKERNGLNCVFWMPFKNLLERGSIIFLWDEKEWWKVSEAKEDNDGILVDCYPSDQTPSF